jgi:hypothetical protein
MLCIRLESVDGIWTFVRWKCMTLSLFLTSGLGNRHTQIEPGKRVPQFLVNCGGNVCWPPKARTMRTVVRLGVLSRAVWEHRAYHWARLLPNRRRAFDPFVCCSAIRVVQGPEYSTPAGKLSARCDGFVVCTELCEKVSTTSGSGRSAQDLRALAYSLGWITCGKILIRSHIKGNQQPDRCNITRVAA